MRLVRGDPVINLAPDGIAPDPGVDADFETRQIRDERLEHRQGRDAAIGDDERTPDAVFLQVIGDELACAGAEVNDRGKGETMDHDRHSEKAAFRH
jgi:hypothetical protein